MLKTLEKNWGGEVLKGYWKQFAEWVIALRSKWHDPLVKSEVTVVLLQIAFALVIIIFAYVFFSYMYEGLLQTIIQGITESIKSDGATNGGDIAGTLQVIKAKNFILFTAILAAVTATFTFLIAKLTLRPAKNALDSQKRFISDIAHELRTPLAIIKTNNEVALMEKDVDPKVKNMIEDNIEELNRMSEIINNILSFNSLLRPQRKKFANIDLGPLIDSVVRKLQDLSEKKNLEITIKKITPHVVWGNAVALEQVISNLLKNAINYTPPGGNVTVRVGPDYYGNVLLHIEDTGVGITRKDLMHIFEPFYRAERSRKRSDTSSGLGLTIARELVKMHSGRITIKSAENRGTTAIVTLPYGRDVDTGEEHIDLSGLNEVSIDFLRAKK